MIALNKIAQRALEIYEYFAKFYMFLYCPKCKNIWKNFLKYVSKFKKLWQPLKYSFFSLEFDHPLLKMTNFARDTNFLKQIWRKRRLYELPNQQLSIELFRISDWDKIHYEHRSKRVGNSGTFAPNLRSSMYIFSINIR